MEAQEFLNGGMEELQTMLSDLENRDVCVNQVNVYANEGKRLERELKQENDSLAKDIEDSIKSERAKATADEDKIIADGNKRIKDIRSERNKAKDRGIKERIENETNALITENRDLHRMVRKTLKENDLPAYCDTKWFYALYCTQGGIEWLVKILVFIMGLVGIPAIVVALTNPWWFLKFIVWVIVAVVFIGVYMTIYLLTKDKDNGTLEDMRAHRYKIADNDKEIRKIKKGIRQDTDESQYNLGEFDTKAAEVQAQVDEAVKVREDKLKFFEENTSPQLIKDINEKHTPLIEAKKDEINKKVSEYQEAVTKSNEVTSQITNTYEQFLTKQYATKSGAQKMMELIQNGQAQNIGQALQILNQ